MNKFKIPGLSWSWKRALGLTALRKKLSDFLGIPTTRSGLEKKIGSAILDIIFKRK